MNMKNQGSVGGTSSQGLLGATLGFFIGFAAVALFGSTANKINQVMSMSPVLLGFLVAAPALSGSLLRIPFSAWVDTTGGRKPFLVLLGLSIAGMLGLFLVIYFLYPNQMTLKYYPLLLVLGMLSGCGIATFSVGISQVAYWYPQQKQGIALGAYAGVGNLAPGLFTFLLPFALSSWGLAGSYLAWLIFLLMGTVLYAWLGKNAWYFQLVHQGKMPAEAKEIAREKYGQQIFPKGNLLSSLSLSAGKWKTWVLVTVYFTTFGGFLALTAWLPTYWISFFQVSSVQAGILTACYSILASLIRIVGGRISDQAGGEKTTIFSLSLMLAGALVMFQSHVFLLSLGASIALALGMGVANAAVFKLVPQEVPEAVGGAAGWVGGLGAFGGFVIPPVLGIFVRIQGNSGYAHGFIVFAVLAFISLLLAFILKKHRLLLNP